MTGLILQRADQANQEDYDVLEDGTVIGCIFLSPAAPEHRPWEWAADDHEGRPPTYGFEPTREEAMAAFAKSWRGGSDSVLARGGGDKLSENLREVLIACIQRGMQLPLIICAVSPNGSVYCIRCNGESEPDMLAHHVEPEGFRLPVTFMVADQTGASVRISVEKGRLTFH
jgi:hypothetical protein